MLSFYCAGAMYCAPTVSTFLTHPQIDVCRILLMGKVYVQLGEGEVYSGIG